uniref:Uncharacterized protein n=1 Tax=Siphoviridae sp. ctxjx4 TaxID=2826522 RepID=A0A8S5M2B0_9CAUD|nr:MAG TPA: hypothetical protein [Siphoviridae sp. ctxjx4]
MTDGLSAADVMALSRDDENNWMNNPFIYLVWMWMFGANGWNRNNDASMQGALTRSDLFEGFNNQDVNGQLRGITSGICDGFYAMNNSLKDGFFGTQSAIADSRFAQQSCCCETNRNIDSVRAENYKNTCEITTAIHNEGELTRALINQNTTQALRDKLADTDRDLQTARFQLSQQTQNATLIDALRPCPIPAYLACSPYSSLPTNTGCNNCYSA